MNLNKTLCKYFDKDKNGIVKIKDIVTPVTITILGLYIAYQGILNTIDIIFYDGMKKNVGFSIEGLNQFLGIVGIAVGLTVLVAIVAVFIYEISNIEVAKCELKKDENDDTDN